MAYSTLAQAQDSSLKSQDALDAAADVVQSLAPAPSAEDVTAEELADYEGRAARAERALYRYIVSDAPNLSGKSLSGVGSFSYKTDREARRLVREIMGSWCANSLPLL